MIQDLVMRLDAQWEEPTPPEELEELIQTARSLGPAMTGVSK
jgi:hypothetical protein